MIDYNVKGHYSVKVLSSHFDIFDLQDRETFFSLVSGICSSTFKKDLPEVMSHCCSAPDTLHDEDIRLFLVCHPLVIPHFGHGSFDNDSFVNPGINCPWPFSFILSLRL